MKIIFFIEISAVGFHGPAIGAIASHADVYGQHATFIVGTLQRPVFY